MCSAVQLCYTSTVMYLCRMTSSVFHDVAYPSMFCVHLYIVKRSHGCRTSKRVSDCLLCSSIYVYTVIAYVTKHCVRIEVCTY